MLILSKYGFHFTVAFILSLAISQTQGRTHYRIDNARHSIHAHSEISSIVKSKIVVCDICPNEIEISPCTCVCHNTTSADIKCGPALTSCSQLTEILNVATPVAQYLRLLVHNTNLGCVLKNDMWGPTTFQEIILRENNFCTIDNHAFVHFNSTLKILNLEKNKLEYICFSTLSEQPLIERVFLAGNKIQFLPSQGSVALSQLNTIDLKHNLLSSIQSNTFISMPRLKVLDLSYNQIESLAVDSFAFENRVHPNHKLTINLSHNKLKTIPKNIVSGVMNVTIDLRHNNMQRLPEDAFDSILQNTNYKSKIMVTGNPINCDIGICWIVGNKTIAKTFDNFICNNTQLTLSDLNCEDLGCKGTTTILV